MTDHTPTAPTADEVRQAARTVADLAAYLRTYPPLDTALPLLKPLVDEDTGVPVKLGDALIALYRIAANEPGLPGTTKYPLLYDVRDDALQLYDLHHLHYSLAELQHPQKAESGGTRRNAAEPGCR
ncbi:hypothetical protein AB0L75_28400 [Streptomyces sp. NPDC052101]|uniref:hypothetical protein n=1 Tax=Streptomyces sp. NPDC052101 TaxID=3155763 RepID=UPI00341C2FFA